MADAPSSAVQRRLYELMVLMKTADDRLAKGISSGEVICTYWPPRGQEAIPAAIGNALRPDDQLVTTYRGLADWIGKGVPLTEIFGEMLGRTPGAARGKGGTMHIASPEHGLMFTTGIVGSGVSIAAGLGLAAKRQGSGKVVAVCFGDGATTTGGFHEGANMAAVWDAPVVLICQNNTYSEFTPLEETTKLERVADRALAFGIPGVTVDGNDPEAVLGVLEEAVDRARSGGGPTFVECETFRLRGHYFGDPMAYIPKDDLAAAAAADPVLAYRDRLAGDGVLSADELDSIDAAAAKEVEDALEAVLAAPVPGLDELLIDVYADSTNCPN